MFLAENKPSVSVIVPCFNDGTYLRDAIYSVERCEPTLFEILIIDDGSTDLATCATLADLESEGYCVIHQSNQGPAASRNRGIQNARGEYILPLDADNRIRPNYITKGLEILEAHKEISVVYGRPEHFGDDSVGIDVSVGPFDIRRLLTANYIDTCALIRKSSLVECGGYDEDRLVQGHEDWDLWLTFAEQGKLFYFLDEVTFEYRLRSNSLSRSMSPDRFKSMKKHLMRKHLTLELWNRISELETNLAASERALEYIHRSKAWRIIVKFRSLRDRFGTWTR